MKKYVAFLRAINVGGHNVIKMDQLKMYFKKIGFESAETFIASGNVIFEWDGSSRDKLEMKIEKYLSGILGNQVTTFIRTIDELNKIVRYQAFTKENYDEAVANNIGFLKEPLNKEGVKILQTLETNIDDFHSHNSEVYWICKKGQSKSKFSGNLFEKKLKMQVTFRGVNSLQRLIALYS